MIAASGIVTAMATAGTAYHLWRGRRQALESAVHLEVQQYQAEATIKATLFLRDAAAHNLQLAALTALWPRGLRIGLRLSDGSGQPVIYPAKSPDDVEFRRHWNCGVTLHPDVHYRGGVLRGDRIEQPYASVPLLLSLPSRPWWRFFSSRIRLKARVIFESRSPWRREIRITVRTQKIVWSTKAPAVSS